MIAKLLIVILIYSFIQNGSTLQDIYPFTTIGNCSASQYYDVEYFKCMSCDSGFVKSQDEFSCICPKYNKFVAPKNSSKSICTPCKNTEYVSNDRSACVLRNCTKKANGRISCSVCDKNQIIVTNNINGSSLPVVECVTCAPGFTPSPDKKICLPCNPNTDSCNCDLKQNALIENICISNGYIGEVTSRFPCSTPSGEKCQSYLENVWIVSSYLCSLNNKSACQTAANICVLTLYDGGANSPCRFWKSSKVQAKPEIVYEEDDSFAILHKKKINLTYSLEEFSEQNHVDIVAIGYDMDGRSSQFFDSTARWLLPCPSNWKEISKNFLKFGVDFKYQCSMGVRQLIEQQNDFFYEAFLRYNDKSSKDGEVQLYALPVLIKSNLIDFNKDNDINGWHLVRRFFIIDKISGKGNSNRRHDLRYIRYAKSIHISIRIRKKGKGERSKIYPPLLTIQYAEASEEDISANSNIGIDFSVTFDLEGGSMVNGIEISVGTLSAFAFLYTVLQIWSYAKRSGKYRIDLRIILQFFIFTSANLSNVFFIVSYGASLYSFFVYKMQKVIYTTIPSQRDEFFIRTFIITAFSLKIVELIALNWQQINVDVVFLDWEKPPLPMNELSTKNSNIRSEQPVSFWRPYFIVKEWSDLQTLRKISVPAHFIICLVILEVFGLSSWTNVGIDARSDNLSGLLSPPSYQLALSGLVFIVVYFTQLIISSLIYERYIKNSILDFMDICSISNVSMLIFDEFLHGYYLHGRSVQVSCDNDIRGLQPGLPFRAFSFRSTSEFRMYFTRLSCHVMRLNETWQWQHHLFASEQLNPSSRIDSGRRSASKSSKKENESVDSVINPTLSPELEQRAQAAVLTNKFLTAFFDHALEDLDYEVREKRYIEKLLDIELMEEGANKTVLLYNAADDSQSFQRTIWYGQEWTLTTFDLYLFCIVQIMTGNYVLAAIINIVVWKFLAICRKYGGKRNLAKKTLVDARFLK